jgi:predicted nuclease with TOPRIM domain
LNTSHTTLMRVCDDLRKNLKEEQDKNEKLRAQLAVMENKNDRLTKELAILTDDNRKLDKKLISLRKELHASEEVRLKQEAVLARLKEMGYDLEDIIVRAEPVNGQVLAVDPETDIVVISVGENAHVTKGMGLHIYRGTSYVGKIIVISVFPDMSSGRIIRSHTKREVKPGDNVTNRF